MRLEELLASLRRSRILIWREGERLRFKAPTGALTPELREELGRHKIELLARVPVGSKNLPIEAPLSEPQLALWFIYQAMPDSRAFNVSFAARILSEADAPLLERAISTLTARHGSLRTTYHRGLEPYQQVHPTMAVDFGVSDASAWSEEELTERARETQRLPFDLERGPLLRVHLFSRSKKDHVLLIAAHHIAVDGWSMWQLLDELRGLYGAETPMDGQPSSSDYLDYVQWQQRMLDGPVGEGHRQYWREQLADVNPVLELPTDRPRPVVRSMDGATYPFRIQADLTARLKALARSEGVSLHTLLLSAFYVLLSRYSGQDDIVIGSVMSGRTRQEFENTLGCFVNTLPLRAKVAGDKQFTELLHAVRSVFLGASEHQDFPFRLITTDLEIPTNPSMSPLFQVDFVFHKPQRFGDLTSALSGSEEDAGVVDFGGLELKVYALRQQEGQVDLTLELMETGAEELAGNVKFDADLFDRDTIAGIAEHYEQLLESVATDPDTRISELGMLADHELQDLAIRSEGPTTKTAAWARESDTLHGSFERRARENPNAMAISCGTEQITYEELNIRANSVARRLVALGVAAGSIVAVHVDRSIELIVGILGILKAGSAYLPLDRVNPPERLAFMLEDSAAQAVVSQGPALEWMQRGTRPVLDLDEVAESDTDEALGESAEACDDALAYIIYTSGSTGKPKGVEVTHANVLSLLEAGQPYFGFGQDDVWTMFHSAAFDFSVWEIFGSLLFGSRLVIVPFEGSRDPATFHAMLMREGVTILNQTPSAFLPLIEADQRAEMLPSLRWIIFGGEALDPPSLRPWVERYGDERPGIVNMYGITETTVHVTHRRITLADVETSSASAIGTPLPHLHAYVLGSQMEPLPRGVAGELYVGGSGLARGYRHRPELTAERFVESPFPGERGDRLYRTGDLVRRLTDGGLEYLGRVDQQVKIRGFRIELGEIDALVAGHQEVRECATIAREDSPGDQRLVSYLVASQPTDQLQAELMDLTRSRLPDYMVPSAFVVLDQLPLTANGKLDRKALPAPDRQALVGAEAHVPASTKVEKLLVGMWEEMLRVESVGVHDNFFELGGHSLLMLQVHQRIVEELDTDLAVVELFEFSTIAALAERLEGVNEAPAVLEEAQRRRAERTTAVADDAIAIVGMAGRFPGAASVEALWRSLCAGEELIRHFTDEELSNAGLPDYLLKNPDFVGSKGFLADAELFDGEFFGYSPRESELMDPQQRLFLECAWTVMENAGYVPGGFSGSVGVFGGAGRNTYRSNLDSRPELAAYLGLQVLGGESDFLTTRVSYKLNLSGPSVNVQTACSTSLVAVHMACVSLRAHECDVALAGGVTIGVPRVNGYVYQEDGILSPDGHCRTFDASAKGTVGSDGVGMVALRRLDDALADGDVIHAVIRGTAINNDGSEKVGFTAPGIEGQSRVIAMALADAGVDPSTVGYVEAHGTGTTLGDPIEIAALTRAYRLPEKADRGRGIGSLKSNVGHMDTAAGVASLIKTVLCLEHGELVPSLHFTDPNPQIDFEKAAFYVTSEHRAWEAPEGHPRRAAVSSFGMGGTNAHMVLEEAPERAPSEANDRLQVLTVSARTKERLAVASAMLAEHLASHPQLLLSDVAHTLQTARKGFKQRKVVLARTSAEAVAALTGEGAASEWTSTAQPDDARAVFMFPGQGAQYAGMGRGLYETEAVFRGTIDECAEQLGDVLGRDLRGILYASEPAADAGDVLTGRTLVTQAALFAVELAMARQWMSWGIEPIACIGHSVGEYVAACVSGALTLEDALGLLKVRGLLMEGAPEGAMIAVPLDEAALTPRLGEGVWLSVINGPEACVVSGVPECVAALETELKAEGIECRRLHTAGAFHSGLMDGVIGPLTEAAQDIEVHPIAIPYVSNVTGDWMNAADLNATYWGRHVRETVRFHDGLSRLLEHEATVLLEVGPGNALGTLARRLLRAEERTDVTVLTSLRHAREEATEEQTVGGAIGRLWGAGLEPDWPAFAGPGRQRVQLPTYPFARERYWIEPGSSDATLHRRVTQGRGDLGEWFHVPVWKQVAPPTAEPLSEEMAAGPWLVFVDGLGVGEAAASALEARGYETIRVQPGEGFAKLETRAYAVDPGSADAFRSLFEHLTAAGVAPSRVLHTWCVANGKDDADAFDRGFYSLLYLLQAVKAPEEGVLGVTVMTNRTFSVAGEPVWHPQRAALLALCRVAPQNVPGLRCFAVDLDDTSGSTDFRALLPLLEAPTAQVLAYRHGRHFVRTLDPMPLPPVADGQRGLRDRGSYLITGGLGNVGLALAKFLATTVQARLTLVSRSGLPSDAKDEDPRVAAVRALEAAGADVLVVQADVTNADQLGSAIEHAERRFGALHGVIHAAGVTSGETFKTLNALTRLAFEEQFGTKWHGVTALREALGDRVLDFCLLTSSLSVELGGLQFGAYAAANTVMSHLCEQFNREDATRWISVDWDGWDFQGALEAGTLELAFTPEEGGETFDRILATYGFSTLAVCTGDFPTRLAGSIPDFESIAEPDTKHERPDLDTDYEAPRDGTEEAIAAAWGKALGLERVGAHDDFFELGGDSLMALQFMGELNSTFQIDIGVQALFDAPTVAQLAREIEILKVLVASPQPESDPDENREEFLL